MKTNKTSGRRDFIGKLGMGFAAVAFLKLFKFEKLTSFKIPDKKIKIKVHPDAVKRIK